MFTYRDLLSRLRMMTPEQLDQDVTVYVEGSGDYFELIHDHPVVESGPENDVLDEGHVYLVV